MGMPRNLLQGKCLAVQHKRRSPCGHPRWNGGRWADEDAIYSSPGSTSR